MSGIWTYLKAYFLISSGLTTLFLSFTIFKIPLEFGFMHDTSMQWSLLGAVIFLGINLIFMISYGLAHRNKLLLSTTSAHYEVLRKLEICVVVIDKQGKIRFANQTFQDQITQLAQWLPATPKKLINTSYLQLCSDPDKHQAFLNNPTSAPLEMSIGNEIFKVCAEPIHTGKGIALGLLIQWKSITQEKNQQRWDQVIHEQVTDSSEELTQVSISLKKCGKEMAERAENSLGEASSASDFGKQVNTHVQELADTLEQNLAKVQDINKQVSQNSSLVAQASNEAKLANSNFKAFESVGIQIEKSLQDIGNIMRQTHILSVNAAIEANRAGQLGKGFAVIAEEIRNLAQNTSNVTESIKKDIKELLEKLPRALAGMQKVQDAVNELSSIGQLINQEMDHQIQTSGSVNQTMQQANKYCQQIVSQMTTVVQDSQNLIETIHQEAKLINQIDGVSQTFTVITHRLNEPRIVSPNDVFRLMFILNQMFDELFFKKLMIGRKSHPDIKAFEGKKPADVLQKTIDTAMLFLECFRISEDKLHFPQGSVTPTQVYGFVSTFVDLVETTLTEQKVPNVHQLRKAQPVEGKNPNDVFGLIDLGYRKMELMCHNVEKKGQRLYA